MKIITLITKSQVIAAVAWVCIFSFNSLSAQITLTKGDVTCHGCTDGWAKLKVIGGTPPIEYIWPDGSTDSMKTNLAPGYYTVVILDANGCSGSKSVTIYDKPEPPDDFEFPVLAALDPNDITGPAGYSDPKWVSVNDQLPYLIRFENDPKFATAAVNKVVITHPIDDMANMFSFRLGGFTFRNFSYEIPPNTTNYFKRLNLVDTIGVYIDVTAGIDVTKKQAFWIFQAFDPVTGLPNIDPSLGFLPINDTITHAGEGSVNFTIKPKNNAKTGDTIQAFASIVFDINAPLLTNVAFNTIDAKPPVSRIKTINTIGSDLIEVSWSGIDDSKGSGVGKYMLLVSSNDQPYNNLADITDTSYIINLAGGNEYKIQSIAKDNTNNTEQLKPLPDTIFYIRPAVQLGKNLSICTNDSIVLNAGSGFSSYKWNDGSTSQTLTVKSAGIYYVTAAKDTLVSSDTVSVFVNQIPQPNLHNNIQGFCEGETLFLNAGSGFRNYSWNTQETSQSIEVSIPGKYFVTVTDNNGCQAQDSISISLFTKPFFSLGDDAFLLDRDSLVLMPVLKGSFNYLWSDNSINDSLLIIGEKTAVGNHKYWLRLTDNRGCSFTDTINISVKSTINVEFGNPDRSRVILYPNPTADYLNLFIEGIEFGDLKLELFNLDGVLLLIKEYQNSNSIVRDQLNLRNLAPGSYILKFTYKDTEISRTIVKL